MADPAPAEGVDDAGATDAPAPDDRQGQEPAPGDAQPDDGQGPSGKTFSEAYVRQLRREASGYRSRLADVETRLQEYEDRDKSEHERLAEKLTSAEARASEAETRLLRFEVAAAKGLDANAAAFLVGSTREEVEASADELAKLIQDKPKPTASFDGGARQTTPEARTPEEAHNDFLLRAMGRAPERRAS